MCPDAPQELPGHLDSTHRLPNSKCSVPQRAVAVDVDDIDSQEEFMSFLALLNDEEAPDIVGAALRDEAAEDQPADHPFDLLDTATASGELHCQFFEQYDLVTHAVQLWLWSALL